MTLPTGQHPPLDDARREQARTADARTFVEAQGRQHELLAFMNLFPELRESSWDGWRTHVASKLTSAIREFYGIVGRGAGKSRFVALLACFFASRSYRRVSGEYIYVGIFAPDKKQSGVTFRYVVGMLKSVPVLAALIVNETRDSIELSNGVIIEVITASTSAPRGRAYAAAIVEEAAFLDDEQSANPDVELLRALRPALARVPGSLLAIVGSAYAQRGVLFEGWKKYHDQIDGDVLVVKAATLDLNPTFDRRAIEKALADDPAGASAEYLSQFRSDVTDFITADTITACVVPGRREMAWTSGINYVAFVDPSGGSGSDSFTLAIGHRAMRGTQPIAVIDAKRETRPPLSPEATVADYAAVLKTYHIQSVVGDRYAGEWPREAFRRHGIEYQIAEKAKSDLYRDALALLNSGHVELLDDARLIQQLSTLERRTARGGRDSIDHAPGAHDDIANVVCGVAVLTAAPVKFGFRTFDMWTGHIVDGMDNSGNIWKGGRPWTGVFGPERDVKGRPINRAARYVNGVYLGDVV